MIDSFIPVELAVAPNPLGLPFNLKLTAIPIDAYTCFELWMPDAGGTLLPEEAMLLRGDRSRLEEICAKLTDLLGATLSHDEELHYPAPVDRWQQVQSALYDAGVSFDAIGVTYLPPNLYPNPISKGGLTAWTLQEARWCISFLKLQPLPLGFRSHTLPIKATIAFGQSITKVLQSTPVLTHRA
ncbi:MAG: hypothetical protein RBJ76_08990 [Stenomitos frigidus ULC029]